MLPKNPQAHLVNLPFWKERLEETVLQNLSELQRIELDKALLTWLQTEIF